MTTCLKNDPLQYGVVVPLCVVYLLITLFSAIGAQRTKTSTLYIETQDRLRVRNFSIRLLFTQLMKIKSWVKRTTAFLVHICLCHNNHNHFGGHRQRYTNSSLSWLKRTLRVLLIQNKLAKRLNLRKFKQYIDYFWSSLCTVNPLQ